MTGTRAAAAAILGAMFLAVSGAAPGAVTILQETLPGIGSRYTLVLPADRAPRAPVPLVVSLHYGGPVSPWYGRGLLEGLVEPALRPLGAIMVAPDCPEPAWMDCAAVVDRIIAHVQARHGTDPGCVILTGFSKGGIGTWSLAGRDPGGFAAAVVMAARAPGPADLDAWRLPVRVIHGAADELFPAGAAMAAVERLRAAGVDAAIRVLEGVSHYDTHRFAAPLAELVPWLRERCPRGR